MKALLMIGLMVAMSTAMASAMSSDPSLPPNEYFGPEMVASVPVKLAFKVQDPAPVETAELALQLASNDDKYLTTSRRIRKDIRGIKNLDFSLIGGWQIGEDVGNIPIVGAGLDYNWESGGFFADLGLYIVQKQSVRGLIGILSARFGVYFTTESLTASSPPGMADGIYF